MRRVRRLAAVAIAIASMSPVAARAQNINVVKVTPGGAVLFNTDDALLPSDANGVNDAYVYTAERGLQLVAPPPAEDGPASVSGQDISPDGTRAIVTTGAHLSTLEQDAATDADVYEILLTATPPTVTLVSGQDASAGSAGAAKYSRDGSAIFFRTTAILIAADGNGAVSDLYRRKNNSTVLVSDRSDSGALDAQFADASDDGSVVYWSTDQPAVASDDDTARDIYRDMGALQTPLLVSDLDSGAGSAADPESDASFARANADGSELLYAINESQSTIDGDNSTDVYRRTISPPTVGTPLVMTEDEGSSDFNGSAFPDDVAPDLSEVVFGSSDPFNQADSTHDEFRGTGTPGPLELSQPSLLAPAFDLASTGFRAPLAPGKYVLQTNEKLSPLDASTDTDAYLRDADGGVTTLLTPGATDVFVFAVAADASRVLIQTGSPLDPADTDSAIDLYLVGSGAPELVTDALVGTGGAQVSGSPPATSDLSHIVMVAEAPLVPADQHGGRDVYEYTDGFLRLLYGERDPPESTATTARALTNDSTPDFTLGADEALGRLECALDGATFAVCPAAFTAPALADGVHTLSARAIDTTGNGDTSPATVAFTVDTVAPDTSIGGLGATTLNATPALTVSATEAGATFTCTLDGAPLACAGGALTLPALGAGAHAVTAVATDAAGNADATAATAAFTLVAAPPVTPPVIPPLIIARDTVGPKITITKATVRLKNGKVGVPIACPKAETAGCKGTLTLKSGIKKLGVTRFSIAAGKTKTIAVKVKGKPKKAAATAVATDAAGNKGTAKRTLKIKT